MKNLPTDYTVWFHLTNFGTAFKTVKAVDAVEAIELVKAPLVEKYGDNFEWQVSRVLPSSGPQ